MALSVIFYGRERGCENIVSVRQQIGQIGFFRRGPGAEPERARGCHGESWDPQRNLDRGLRWEHRMRMLRCVEHARAVERLEPQFDLMPARRGLNQMSPWFQ